jgi:hypothetical protein
MHDPMTQILYIPQLGILWHVDPCRGGGDDTCNWSGYRNNLTDAETAWLRKEGEQEHTYFFRGVLQYDDMPDGRLAQNTEGRRWPGGMVHASALEVLYAVWNIIHWRQPRKGWRGDHPYMRLLARWRHQREMAAALPDLLEMVGSPIDSLHSLIGRARAADDDGQKAMGELFVAVARIMRGARRPWWKHPRFHVHHWRLQLFPLQNFKRWAFTRCAKCGKGFKWGHTGVGSWDGDGPTWFKSEQLEHFDCDRPAETGGPAPAVSA